MNRLSAIRGEWWGKRPLQLVSALILSFVPFLWLGLSAVSLPAAPTPVPRDTWCVKPGGGDGCLAAINDALAMAQENDMIQVAAGIYNENVLISRTVILQGGWSLDFSVRDLSNYSSTITPADNTQSVVSIQGQAGDASAVAPTLDGFAITGGRAHLGFNHGGGLRIIDSDALVISNTIQDNVAFLLGGGVWVQRGAPILEGNHILDNQTVGGGITGVARGGGVQLENTGATLLENAITGNSASGLTAYGGGVDIISAAGGGVTLIGNTVRINTADGEPPQHGFGGGIAISGANTGQVILTNNQVISNEASIEPDGAPQGYGFGGGIFVGSGEVQLVENRILGNVAGSGGGIALTCVNPGTPEEDCWNVAGGNNAFRQNTAGTSGGGIFIGGDLEDCCNFTANDNLIQANTAVQGGGIYIGGDIEDCCQFKGTNTQIQENDATEGGGLYNDDQFVALRRGLVISNTAVADGGGVFISAGGIISLTNSAAIANLVGQDGGAIYNSGLISVSNTTVSGNSASGMGGGIANFNVVSLVNATVSDNASADGAGVFNANLVNTVNSLIALNIGDNCLGAMNSLGHNLEDGFTCALDQPTDMANTAPSMDPLGENDGSTPTHALAADSPAIDAGDNTACAPTDQRGVPRPVDGDADGQAICDIGAFEFQIPTTTTILADTPDPSSAGESFTATVSVTAPLGLPTGVVTVTVSDSPPLCSTALAGGKGSCTLTLSTSGTYTLTANYSSNDSAYVPSSTTEVHTVEMNDRLYLPVIWLK